MKETITRREAMMALAVFLELADAGGAQTQASATPVFTQDLPKERPSENNAGVTRANCESRI